MKPGNNKKPEFVQIQNHFSSKVPIRFFSDPLKTGCVSVPWDLIKKNNLGIHGSIVKGEVVSLSLQTLGRLIYYTY